MVKLGLGTTYLLHRVQASTDGAGSNQEFSCLFNVVVVLGCVNVVAKGVVSFICLHLLHELEGNVRSLIAFQMTLYH